MILKYRTFTSSDEFEKWQKSENPKVVTVTPCYEHISPNMEEDELVSITTEPGVFVVYTIQTAAKQHGEL